MLVGGCLMWGLETKLMSSARATAVLNCHLSSFCVVRFDCQFNGSEDSPGLSSIAYFWAYLRGYFQGGSSGGMGYPPPDSRQHHSIGWEHGWNKRREVGRSPILQTLCLCCLAALSPHTLPPPQCSLLPCSDGAAGHGMKPWAITVSGN